LPIVSNAEKLKREKMAIFRKYAKKQAPRMPQEGSENKKRGKRSAQKSKK